MSASVVIADDQGMIRSGLRSLLEDESDIEVVAEASNGEQALDAIRRFKPDVALMDIRMPVIDGLEVTRRLAEEGIATRILILTTYDLDEYVFDALRSGASGFLLKDGAAEELVAAIRLVAAGEALLSPAVTRRVIESFAKLPSPDAGMTASLEELTERETEVLTLLAKGRTNAEIAEQLIVSQATAKTHVSNVLGKVGVRDRVQAVIFAYESGLVSAEGSPPG